MRFSLRFILLALVPYLAVTAFLWANLQGKAYARFRLPFLIWIALLWLAIVQIAWWARPLMRFFKAARRVHRRARTRGRDHDPHDR